jgi:hypothetical protein
MTRTLIVDIETSPTIADVWGLWQQNVSLNQIRESTRMICFAAQWRGKPTVQFWSEFHDGQEAMVAAAHRLVDEADVVVHYNGSTFDMPHLRREFLMAGLQPPSPVAEVDLLRAVKRRFRFPSNKLAYVTEQLGLSGKLSHTGHDLWVKCMAGDETAWRLMRRYNMQDVRTTGELYDKLLAWLPNHPHVGLIDGTVEDSCSRCGSRDLERRGFAYTATAKFQRYQCRGCGGWSRGKKTLSSVDVRGVAA